MKDGIFSIETAEQLPPEWDNLAIEYFQTREFLAHTQKYNPCTQRYYLLHEAGRLTTGVVVYTLVLDLLTFLAIKSPVRMHIAGIPCSVSASGFIGKSSGIIGLIRHIQKAEKGFHLYLNLETPPPMPKTANGQTLPTVLLKNRFKTWEEYKGSLRSAYRRRLKQTQHRFRNVHHEKSDCSMFNGESYAQYLQVLKRSSGKLETLSMSFFQNLPRPFHLTRFFLQNRLLGWYISATYGDRYYFFLGGIDYGLNRQYNTYFNLLLQVLREGIEWGAALIDLGQTAEIAKSRLGGVLVPRYMLGSHSNRLFNRLLFLAKGLLACKYRVPDSHVLKSSGESA